MPVPSEPAAKAGGDEEGWTPPRLPKVEDPKGFEIAADSTEALDIPAAAFETLRSGQTLKVRLLEANEVRLSDLSGLPRLAMDTPGRLVVELHGDG